MAIALPITQPEPEGTSHDNRHYTDWTQVKAPQVIYASDINPLPEDAGTVATERHFTEWRPKT